MPSTIYLIPTLLSEAIECLPAYILQHINDCSVLYVENERTARRFLKLLSREIVIDNFEWHNMKDVTAQVEEYFRNDIKKEKNIGIISEAGCPGIADPGQQLVAIAQQMNATVRPLVGPSSILLALMASGMNGQQFAFHGYLPIDHGERVKAIKKLEASSTQKNQTQIFIETPYRNNQLLEALIKSCQSNTRLCIAADLTGKDEMVKTKTIATWKKEMPQLHKRPVIFLMYAGSDALR